MNIVGGLLTLAVGLVWAIVRFMLWSVALLLQAAGAVASGAWDDEDG